MKFRYTNSWEEFEEYCEELYHGYLNRYRQNRGESWKYEMQRHYVAEMKFIRKRSVHLWQFLSPAIFSTRKP